MLLTAEVDRVLGRADEHTAAVLCVAGEAGKPTFDLRTTTRQ
jgi:hypothetical protein